MKYLFLKPLNKVNDILRNGVNDILFIETKLNGYLSDKLIKVFGFYYFL